MRCPAHAYDDPECTGTLAAEAVGIILEAKTTDQAAAIAIEAMRQMCRMTGAKMPREIEQLDPLARRNAG